MACSQSEIQDWAKGINVPECVASAFCAQYGRLPNSIPDLDTWGDATGYRHAGAWTCTPSGNPGSGQPGDKPVSVSGSGSGSATVGVSGGSGLLAWVQQNQVLAAGVIGGVAILLSRGR